MASVRKYATAKGHAWRVQYRSPDGKSRTKQGFRTKAEAQAWADKNAVAVREHDWIDPSAGKVTVGVLMPAWEATLTHLKPKTRHEALGMWRRCVEPAWSDRQVASIKTSEVQAWVSGIDKSASYVRQVHAVLAQILDLAVQDKALRANPARGVKLPRKVPKSKTYLTANQLGMLAQHSGDYAPLVWLLGTVGLRWGEAAALRACDVNVLRRRISVERNAVLVGREVIIGTPKTHEVRQVAVPASVMNMLRPLVESRLPDALLWPGPDGAPLRVPSPKQWFYKAVSKCRAEDDSFPALSPHGLRHTAASLMVSSGANVKVVQSQLGHASAAMTLDTYSDLFDEDLDAVGAAMDTKISDVVELSWGVV